MSNEDKVQKLREKERYFRSLGDVTRAETAKLLADLLDVDDAVCRRALATRHGGDILCEN